MNFIDGIEIGRCIHKKATVIFLIGFLAVTSVSNHAAAWFGRQLMQYSEAKAKSLTSSYNTSVQKMLMARPAPVVIVAPDRPLRRKIVLSEEVEFGGSGR